MFLKIVDILHPFFGCNPILQPSHCAPKGKENCNISHVTTRAISLPPKIKWTMSNPAGSVDFLARKKKNPATRVSNPFSYTVSKLNIYILYAEADAAVMRSESRFTCGCFGRNGGI